MFAHASRRFGWVASLLARLGVVRRGRRACSAPSRCRRSRAPASPRVALVVMLAGCRGAAARADPVRDPRTSELAVRVAAALAIAAAVTLGASTFGPRVSGILLAFPITGSVLPAFTLALHGSDATVRLLAGFLSGLFAFAAFHLVVASRCPRGGARRVSGRRSRAGLAAAGVVMRIRARWPNRDRSCQTLACRTAAAALGCGPCKTRPPRPLPERRPLRRSPRDADLPDRGARDRRGVAAAVRGAPAARARRLHRLRRVLDPRRLARRPLEPQRDDEALLLRHRRRDDR